MRRDTLERLLRDVAEGEIDPAAALRDLSWVPVEEVGEDGQPPFARLDHHRSLRHGYPEVVFCPNKQTDQIVDICRNLLERSGGFLATRAEREVRERLAAEFPAAIVHERARIVHHPGAEKPAPPALPTAIVSAGTGDQAVAEEAAVTAEALGHDVRRVYDVGVAGIHRILGASVELQGAGVVIVVAGMEGALPSVVGGLVGAPVLAVPTSVGYGASFGGLAALLGMLNSCAAGVTVLNIDNGFGAAYAADRIQRMASRAIAERG